MKTDTASFYRCPATNERLQLEVRSEVYGRVIEGELRSRKNVYKISAGVPDLTWPKDLAKSDQQTLESYEAIADDYDRYAPLPFETYRASEDNVRNRMIDQMEIREDSTVLEIGCGTGRGSRLIANRLSSSGSLFLQEISPRLLQHAQDKLQDSAPRTEFSVANGSYLPFADNTFDAAHHWGGINTFSEIGRCLTELARVVRPGGKVVVGDESMGEWLRETRYGQIMMNSNPLLKCKIPLAEIPTCAQDVRVEWIMMNAFWVLEFRVGEGEPEPNYNVEIPSARGGTHWTRYFGNLEGITDEAKALAYAAQQKSGVSMHDWLENTVRAAARVQLSE